MSLPAAQVFDRDPENSFTDAVLGGWSSHRIAGVALGVVLLAAAALKGHQLATSPVAEDGLLTSRWFLIAVVELELAVGIWLLSGIYAGVSGYVSMALFGAFGLVSFIRALAGETSCGCFGSVAVNPWGTAAFDFGAAAAAWRFKPDRSRTCMSSVSAPQLGMVTSAYAARTKKSTFCLQLLKRRKSNVGST